MATWFECKVKYEKLTENGQQKAVTEPYLVTGGELKVTAVKRTNIAEIFWDEEGDKWYKVKVNFVTIDEKTAVEKKTANFMMVQAADFKKAYDNFMEGMKGTMSDFEVASINETMIMDVYKEDLGGNEGAQA